MGAAHDPAPGAGQPEPARPAGRSSSACAPSTCRWSTRCWPATASSASPRSPRRRPARRSRSSSRGSARRRCRRAARPTSARCAATSATALRGRPAPVPPGVGAEVPIASGDETIGARPAARRAPTSPRRSSSCTSRRWPRSPRWPSRRRARRSSRTCAARSWRSCARGRTWTPAEIVRRAARLGCDLSRGAVVLCAEPTSDRPRHVVATIAGEYPGALAQHMDGRARATRCCPAGQDDAPQATLAAARGSPRACSATASSACPRSTPTRPSCARDPGGRARARRAAALRRRAADRRGHRPRHLPAAVPRARLAPRGGALVLRGHGRADRHATTTSTPPTSSARSRPTSSRTAT